MSFTQGEVSAAVDMAVVSDDTLLAMFGASITATKLDKSGKLTIELTVNTADDEFVAWPLTKMQGWNATVGLWTGSEKLREQAGGMRRVSRAEAARQRRLAKERERTAT